MPGRDVRQLRPLPIGATSDDVDEGSTNLYFTNARLRQACADGSVLDVVRCQSVQVLSDRTTKQNISDSIDPEESLQTICALEPKRYQYRHAPDDDRQGLISQEVPDKFVRVGEDGKQRILLYDLMCEVVNAVRAIEKRIRDVPPQVPPV
jgi:hypothetical protein